MRKILSILILLSLLVLPVSSVLGAPIIPGGGGEVKELKVIHPIEALEVVVNFAFTILLIFAALMIVVAGFFFITAAGDPEKTSTARNFVLYALIGVLVAFLARGMVWLVGKIMGHEITW